MASSKPLNERETISLLMKERDWEGLRLVLALESCLRLGGENGRLSTTKDSPAALNSILHQVCKLQPPLDIVRSLVNLCPEDLKISDDLGRYPLHIAAEFGASSRTIKLLLRASELNSTETAVAAMKDKNGKTPLHWFCENLPSACNHCDQQRFSQSTTIVMPTKGGDIKGRENECCRTSANVVDVLMTFVKFVPETIHVEDNNGMTALEYAMDSDLDLTVMETLFNIGVESRRQQGKTQRNISLGTRRTTRRRSQ